MDNDERVNTIIEGLNPINNFGDTKTRLLVKATTKKKLTVLWNLVPPQTFHCLHAIYAEKFKQLVKANCRIIILFYDEYLASNRPDIPTDEIRIRMRKFGNWLEKSIGYGPGDCKLITETHIWRESRSRDKIPHFMRKLSQICKLDTKKQEYTASEIFENLMEICYENILDPDIVIVGEQDAKEVWGILREEAVRKQIFPEWEPPILLVHSSLVGIDSKPLSSMGTENSIHIEHSEDDVKRICSHASRDFIMMIYDKLILPHSNGVKIGSSFFKSTNDIKNAIETNNLDPKIVSDAVSSYLNDYFTNIRTSKIEDDIGG